MPSTDQGAVQLIGLVPKQMRRKLKQKLAGEDRSYSAWLRAQIQNYIAPKRPRHLQRPGGRP